MLRRLNAEPDLSVTALFQSDISVRGYVDPGFGVRVDWDVPLLEGYPYKFLPAVGGVDKLGFWRPWNYGLAGELRRGKYDAIWIHGYGHAYHLYAMLIARLMGLKVLLRDEAHNRSRVRGALDRLLAAIVYRYMSWTVTGFLAIGTANRQRCLDMGIRPEAIHLVPYAVDNGFFGVASLEEKTAAKAEVCRTLGVEPGRPIVLFAAKLQPRKRCSDLIRAFSREGVWNHPSRPLLIIAGDGEEMGACRELAREVPDESSIRFIGFQNQTRLVQLYRAADIFALTSDAEPWGLTINEAMSAGCAILASDEIGSVLDLVPHGVNGFTCAAGDIDAQAQHLRAMLDDPAKVRKMGEESLRLISGWGFEQDVLGLRQALGLPDRPPSGDATP